MHHQSKPTWDNNITKSKHWKWPCRICCGEQKLQNNLI